MSRRGFLGVALLAGWRLAKRTIRQAARKPSKRPQAKSFGWNSVLFEDLGVWPEDTGHLAMPVASKRKAETVDWRGFCAEKAAYLVLSDNAKRFVFSVCYRKGDRVLHDTKLVIERKDFPRFQQDCRAFLDGRSQLQNSIAGLKEQHKAERKLLTAKLRADVLRRDNYSCQHCERPSRKALQSC